MKKIYYIGSCVLAGLLAALPSQAVVLSNPLDTSDPREIIDNIIKGAMGIVGSIALALFIWGGFKMMMSKGNVAEFTKARDILTYGVIGLAVIFSSYAIVNYILDSIAK